MMYSNIVNITRAQAGQMDKDNKLALAQALLEVAGNIARANDPTSKAKILEAVGKKFGFDFAQDENGAKATAFYRNCALALHPDKFPSGIDDAQRKNLEEAFKALSGVNEARQEQQVINALARVRNQQPTPPNPQAYSPPHNADLENQVKASKNVDSLIDTINEFAKHSPIVASSGPLNQDQVNVMLTNMRTILKTLRLLKT